MPTDHDMPAAWRAQADRNRSPEIAAAIAARARQQRAADAQATIAGPGAARSPVLDELSRRRIARFAAQEARRLVTSPPRGPHPPHPPAAS